MRKPSQPARPSASRLPYPAGSDGVKASCLDHAYIQSAPTLAAGIQRLLEEDKRVYGPQMEAAERQLEQVRREREAWERRKPQEDQEWEQVLQTLREYRRLRKQQPAKSNGHRVKKRRAHGNAHLLTIQEAADRLSVHYQTVRNWIDSGQIPAFKRGGIVRIPVEALAAQEASA